MTLNLRLYCFHHSRAVPSCPVLFIVEHWTQGFVGAGQALCQLSIIVSPWLSWFQKLNYCVDQRDNSFFLIWFLIFLKKYLSYTYDVHYRHTRRGRQIPLHMVMSHLSGPCHLFSLKVLAVKFQSPGVLALYSSATVRSLTTHTGYRILCLSDWHSLGGTLGSGLPQLRVMISQTRVSDAVLDVSYKSDSFGEPLEIEPSVPTLALVRNIPCSPVSHCAHLNSPGWALRTSQGPHPLT